MVSIILGPSNLPGDTCPPTRICERAAVDQALSRLVRRDEASTLFLNGEPHEAKKDSVRSAERDGWFRAIGYGLTSIRLRNVLRLAVR